MTPTPSPTGSALPTASPGVLPGAPVDIFSLLMPILFLVAAVYLLWNAIKARGRLFEFPQYKPEIHPHMKRSMRILVTFLGLIFLAQAVFDFIRVQYLADIPGYFDYVLLGLILAVIVFSSVYWTKKYKKYRK
ncbi:MAG: hypothetical protein Q8O09_01805 [Bacillota bacterium]|nr:hypothetical protein [Bacillota bacterium]